MTKNMKRLLTILLLIFACFVLNLRLKIDVFTVNGVLLADVLAYTFFAVPYIFIVVATGGVISKVCCVIISRENVIVPAVLKINRIAACKQANRFHSVALFTARV